jgi:hypothetical protein
MKRTPDSSLIDPVEEASKDSFPASDPPAWTPLVRVVVTSGEGAPRVVVENAMKDREAPTHRKESA